MHGNSIDVIDFLRKHMSIRGSQSSREFLAEFLGTFILIAFGNASVAQSVLTNQTKNDFFAVVWAWAIGVTFGIMVSGGVSGGHINPAVTLSLAVWGKFPWVKVPIYMVAQYLGAFCASACIYGVYIDAIDVYENKERTLGTAVIFATYPGVVVTPDNESLRFLTAGNGLGDQIFGTMLLLICVMAINDKKNMSMPKFMSPLMVGFVVLNIGLTYGMNSGFAINPARDLAPRIFTLIAGWGSTPFTTNTIDGYAWWWIPVVGPHIGAILGVALYSILIEVHHPVIKEGDETGVTTTKQQTKTNRVSANVGTDAFQMTKKIGV